MSVGLTRWLRDWVLPVVAIAVSVGVVVTLIRRPVSATIEVETVSGTVSIAGATGEGELSAPVVLVTYSDFQCPYCGTFARDVLPRIRREYVRAGTVRVVFRHDPLPIHPLARRAAVAAECAAAAGRFAEMHDALFALPLGLTEDRLVGKATEIGLDRAAFSACLTSAIGRRIEHDMDEAHDMDVRGTPTLFVGRLIDSHTVQFMRKVSGLPTLSTVQRMLREAMQGTGS